VQLQWVVARRGGGGRVYKYILSVVVGSLRRGPPKKCTICIIGHRHESIHTRKKQQTHKSCVRHVEPGTYGLQRWYVRASGGYTPRPTTPRATSVAANPKGGGGMDRSGWSSGLSFFCPTASRPAKPLTSCSDPNRTIGEDEERIPFEDRNNIARKRPTSSRSLPTAPHMQNIHAMVRPRVASDPDCAKATVFGPTHAHTIGGTARASLWVCVCWGSSRESGLVHLGVHVGPARYEQLHAFGVPVSGGHVQRSLAAVLRGEIAIRVTHAATLESCKRANTNTGVRAVRDVRGERGVTGVGGVRDVRGNRGVEGVRV